MRTFCIQTLGCRVNHYEAQQMAALLRSRGLIEASVEVADLRIVHSCSVTVQAASKSRQMVRRSTRLPILNAAAGAEKTSDLKKSAKVVVTGCWASSDAAQANAIAGVDAVLGHDQDVADQLARLLEHWQTPPGSSGCSELGQFEVENQPSSRIGTHRLPQLAERQSGHQRAFLKVQDGCDAHCTYCIIPKLRPTLWSRPIPEVVEEAQRLVAAGHVELVLTGIFLGAYGQETALRRRQSQDPGKPLGGLVEALCREVQGLRRLRLSSLEPCDLDDALLERLSALPQVVPHFHLPLQSGSDLILRRMNRQYGRDDYRRMLDRVRRAFAEPALTTDVIVGFPGETDEEFQRTLEIVREARFIHIHAFSFSPRPGTAAARWTDQFVRGPVVNQRIEQLRWRSEEFSLDLRRRFIGREVEVLVERPSATEVESQPLEGHQHGRCERYFAVHFPAGGFAPGTAVRVRVDRVDGAHTLGIAVGVER